MTKTILGIGIAAILLLTGHLLRPAADAQTMKEYIRAGDRLVAVESSSFLSSQSGVTISAPPSGSPANSATFTFEGIGSGSITATGILISNNALDGTNACYFEVTTTLRLAGNTGVLGNPISFPGPNQSGSTVSNSQCDVTTLPPPPAGSANRVQWSVRVTAKGAFLSPVNKVVYGFTATGGGTYDWASLTVWTPGSSQPAIIGTKPGLFRDGFFWILDLNGNALFEGTGPGQDAAFAFGGAQGDVPIAGDWNGSGRAKAGVYRPTSPALFLLDYDGDRQFNQTNDRVYAFYPSITGDIPVTGDWNGDGRTKIGIYRPGTAAWVLDWNGNGVFDGGDRIYFHGVPNGTDVPVTGDWNGDGKTKIGVVRAGFLWLADWDGDGTWAAATDLEFPLGGFAGDVFLTGNWVPTPPQYNRNPPRNLNTKPGVFRFGWLWGLDSSGDTALQSPPDVPGFAFGGVSGDKAVVGRW